MKVLASVRFNDRKAYILDEFPNYIYYRLGSNIIYGTDGLFYHCYKYDRISPGFSAFGGRKFTITLNTGEVVQCYGQWWDGGYDTLEKELGIKLTHITYNTKEELKKCYVYSGATADIGKLQELIKEAGELYYYDYEDYRKVLTYQDVWDKRWEEERKFTKLIKNLRKDKAILISKVKNFASVFKLFKNQIFINKL